MTYLQQLFGASAAGSVNDERLWTTWAGPVTAAGVPVSADSALKVSTAWACIGLISETIGMLPKLVYKRLANNARERADTMPLFYTLHQQPNPYQTSIEFFEMMTGHAVIRGNAYARIQSGVRGFADALIPIHPDYVTPEETPDGNLRYVVRAPGKPPEVLTDDQVLHLKGRSSNGKTGMSVISYARESMGLSLAAERYGSKFFANDSRPGGVLKHPGTLKDSATKKVTESWRAAHSGDNAHSTAILEEGMEWQSIGLANKDSQFLETREFQAEDICRWFRVPPHMVGLTSKSTSWGSGIEQMSIGFVTYTLMPWIVRWQQAITRDLILAPQTYFVEFVVDALLRGDTLARYNAYQIARNNGWLNVDEIRQRENMNPLPDGQGQVYLQPLNMQPVGAPLTDDARQLDGSTPAASGIDTAHVRAIVREAAARVVRKEVAALTKAQKRGDFAAEVNEFYTGHIETVKQTLAVSDEIAVRWVNAQRDEIMMSGPESMADWETRRVPALVGLVLDDTL